MRKTGIHTTAYCIECNGYIQHMPRRSDDDFVLYFGKYKGRNVKSMLQSKDEREYLVWVYSLETTKDWQKRIISKHIHV
jgi:hypothetical protein